MYYKYMNQEAENRIDYQASISRFRWKEGAVGEWEPWHTQVLGQAIGEFIEEQSLKEILVCGDGRETMEDHIQELVHGVSSRVSSVITSLGVLPTPMARMQIQSGVADMGLVITASHNPIGENGVKIFTQEGYVSQEYVNTIRKRFEELLVSRSLLRDSFTVLSENKRRGIETYVAAVLKNSPELKQQYDIILNVGRGSGRYGFVELLKSCGQRVDLKEAEGRLENYGKSFNPSKLDATDYMEQLLSNSEASIGFALDPDADRLVVTLKDPETQEAIILNGEKIAYVLAHFTPDSAPVVLDVMCSPHTRDQILKLGKLVITSPTGVISRRYHEERGGRVGG